MHDESDRRLAGSPLVVIVNVAEDETCSVSIAQMIRDLWEVRVIISARVTCRDGRAYCRDNRAKYVPAKHDRLLDK